LFHRISPVHASGASPDATNMKAGSNETPRGYA
jgi:hypothetical protein